MRPQLLGAVLGLFVRSLNMGEGDFRGPKSTDSLGLLLLTPLLPLQLTGEIWRGHEDGHKILDGSNQTPLLVGNVAIDTDTAFNQENKMFESAHKNLK